MEPIFNSGGVIGYFGGQARRLLPIFKVGLHYSEPMLASQHQSASVMRASSSTKRTNGTTECGVRPAK